MRPILFAIAAAGLTGCVSITAVDAPPVIDAWQLNDLQAMAIIQARNTVYEELVAVQDVDGLIALHTEDYSIFQPGRENVSGAEAHRAYWEAAFETMNGLSVDEQTVYFAGPDTIISHDFYQTFADGEPIGGGQSVIVWKKVEGTWLVHWEMYN